MKTLIVSKSGRHFLYIGVTKLGIAVWARHETA